MAALVNAQPGEIYFTSCGTESDNWALLGAVLAARQSGAGAAGSSEAAGSANAGPGGLLPHVVSSCIEHPAVLECLEAWRRQVGCCCCACSCCAAAAATAALP